MFDLPPPDPGIEISLASQGMSKGLRQTDGVQIALRPELAFGPIFVGAQYRNLSAPSADGELWAMAGLRGRTAGLDLSASVTFKRWIATRGRPDRDAVELMVSVARPLGPLTPRLAVHYSPDDLGETRASLYAEAGAALALFPGASLSAHIARRERAADFDYTAFNAGATYAVSDNFTLDLRYYDNRRSGLGAIYEPRLVASLRTRF